MNRRRVSNMALVAIMTALLSLGGGLSFAASGDKVKPEKPGLNAQGPAKSASPHLAAKREMVRKQQEQRITHDQRKTAAKNLQAERLKVYNARQAVKNSAPRTIENK